MLTALGPRRCTLERIVQQLHLMTYQLGMKAYKFLVEQSFTVNDERWQQGNDDIDGQNLQQQRTATIVSINYESLDTMDDSNFPHGCYVPDGMATPKLTVING